MRVPVLQIQIQALAYRSASRSSFGIIILYVVAPRKSNIFNIRSIDLQLILLPD